MTDLTPSKSSCCDLCRTTVRLGDDYMTQDCADKTCKCHSPSQPAEKCQPDDKQWLHQFRCKNCGNFWLITDEIPDCKPVEMHSVMPVEKCRECSEGWEKEFDNIFDSHWNPSEAPKGSNSDVKNFIRSEIQKAKAEGYEEGFIAGQKHAFGVDRERVKEEGRREERERLKTDINVSISLKTFSPNQKGYGSQMVKAYNEGLEVARSIVMNQ